MSLLGFKSLRILRKLIKRRGEKNNKSLLFTKQFYTFLYAICSLYVPGGCTK